MPGNSIYNGTMTPAQRLGLSRYACLAVAMILFAGPALGQTFGSVTLSPGQSRQISIGPGYRNIRICNDVTSGGSVVGAVRTGWSRTLSPGECMQDYGNTFYLQNRSSSPALVEYRSALDSNRSR